MLRTSGVKGLMRPRGSLSFPGLLMKIALLSLCNGIKSATWVLDQVKLNGPKAISAS